LVHVVSPRKERSRYCNKLTTATNLVKKVKMIFKNLPSFMLISKIAVDNKQSFELTNGSQVKAATTSGDAGRSEALSLLIIDEAAFVDGLEEFGRVFTLPCPQGVAVSHCRRLTG
jgi:hypothetical protein